MPKKNNEICYFTNPKLSKDKIEIFNFDIKTKIMTIVNKK